MKRFFTKEIHHGFYKSAPHQGGAHNRRVDRHGGGPEESVGEYTEIKEEKISQQTVNLGFTERNTLL